QQLLRVTFARSLETVAINNRQPTEFIARTFSLDLSQSGAMESDGRNEIMLENSGKTFSTSIWRSPTSLIKRIPDVLTPTIDILKVSHSLIACKNSTTRTSQQKLSSCHMILP